MKNTLKKSMVFLALIGFASNVISASADQRIFTKEQLIQELKPKPRIKMRGIRMANRKAEEETNAAPEQAPSVSLNINFAYNSHELNELALKQLQPLGQALESGALESFGFVIQGHTDARGSDEFNMTLSERRALTIGNFLFHNYNIDPSRLNLEGKGETALFDPSNPEADVNRRVQVTTLVP